MDTITLFLRRISRELVAIRKELEKSTKKEEK